MSVTVAELFDYSKSILGYTNEIAHIQAELNTINDKISLFQAAVGYSSVVDPTLVTLIEQQTALSNILTGLQAVLNEMNALSNLDSATKELLYYFYTVVGDNKIDFQVRMPFNYQAALADSIIQELLADNTNPADVKTEIARVVYKKYPMSMDNLHAVTLIYKYQTQYKIKFYFIFKI